MTVDALLWKASEPVWVARKKTPDPGHTPRGFRLALVERLGKSMVIQGGNLGHR